MIPKYRAWNKLASRMYIVNGLHFDRGMVQYANDDNAIRFIKLENIILMQSTGLKDLNGIEIFDGDILEVTDKHSWLEVVSYSQEKAMFVTEEINREFKVPESPLYDLLDSTFLKFKVIGNIYENLELLEVE